jgi:hypothetical protein
MPGPAPWLNAFLWLDWMPSPYEPMSGPLTTGPQTTGPQTTGPLTTARVAAPTSIPDTLTGRTTLRVAARTRRCSSRHRTRTRRPRRRSVRRVRWPRRASSMRSRPGRATASGAARLRPSAIDCFGAGRRQPARPVPQRRATPPPERPNRARSVRGASAFRHVRSRPARVSRGRCPPMPYTPSTLRGVAT